MVLKTARIIRSQVVLIPRSAVDIETDEIPERGLHWGTRESNFIISGIKYSKSKPAPRRKPKAPK